VKTIEVMLREEDVGNWSRTGSAFRGYLSDGTPLYIGAETMEDAKHRIRAHFAPGRAVRFVLAPGSQRANERSKKVNLGFAAIDTRTGEYLSEVFARREPARAAVKELLREHPDRSLGVHTLEAHVPASWKRGDSLEGYAEPRDLAILRGKPFERNGNHGFWSPEDNAEYMRLLDRYDAEMTEAMALEDEGYAAQAAIHRRAAASAERAADRIARRYAANGAAYYVWVLARGSDEPMEGPFGPYDLEGGKTFARIGATEGAHDRAVSLGMDPQAAGFRIVRRYEAGSGERLL